MILHKSDEMYFREIFSSIYIYTHTHTHTHTHQIFNERRTVSLLAPVARTLLAIQNTQVVQFKAAQSKTSSSYKSPLHDGV